MEGEDGAERDDTFLGCFERQQASKSMPYRVSVISLERRRRWKLGLMRRHVYFCSGSARHRNHVYVLLHPYLSRWKDMV